VSNSSSWGVSAEYAFYMWSKVHGKYIHVIEEAVELRHNKSFIKRSFLFYSSQNTRSAVSTAVTLTLKSLN